MDTDKVNAKDYSDSEYEAYIAGCADSYDALFDAIDKMREASNEMLDVFMNENMPREAGDLPTVKTLQVIYATLSTLAERAQGNYFENLDNRKAERGDY
jgi:hypothetical protein